MKFIAGLLPHVTIILSGMWLIFFVLDQFNPSMGYLTNPGTSAVLIALALTSIANAILLIGYQRRRG